MSSVNPWKSTLGSRDSRLTHNNLLMFKLCQNRPDQTIFALKTDLLVWGLIPYALDCERMSEMACTGAGFPPQLLERPQSEDSVG